MKKIIYLILCSIFTAFMSCSKEKDDPAPAPETQPEDTTSNVTYNKYEVKSGIAKYHMKVNGMVFQKYTVYFDNYGSREARYEYDTEDKLASVIMEKGDGWYYNVSLRYQGGTKEKRTYSNGTEGSFSIDYSESRKKELNFKMLSDTVIAGKTCKMYSIEISKGTLGISAGYKGVLLYYALVSGTSRSVTDAVSFEEGATIESKIWDLPSGIPITEE